MHVGIIGFRGAGKTTAFNALTGLGAATGFGGGGRPNLGNIKVPDERVDFLAELDQPKKVTFAEIGFIDAPGAEQHGGGGLDSTLVEQVRDADALILVVRAFASPTREEEPDPATELEGLLGELVLTDQIAVENRLTRIRKEGSKAQDKALMERLLAQLEAGQPIAALELREQDRHLLSGFRFLTLKPWVALINCDAEAASGPLPPPLASLAETTGATILLLAAEAEAEIAELPPEDQAAFSEDIGLSEPARARFIRAVYQRLDLISFLTRGPDECRAWTIRRGTIAKVAAGTIHSDIERGFIRAEVIAFDDYRELKSEAKCRDVGKLRVEGKEYVLQDGDLIHFRFNV